MIGRWFVLLFWMWGCLICQPLYGALPEEAQTALQVASRQFEQEAYEQAIHSLQNLPGVLALIPDLSQWRDQDLAKVYFDLGCCYLAVDDSALANQAFKRAIFYDNDISTGFFKNTEQVGIRLQAERERRRLGQTTRLGAVMRSIALPGLGQMYRGHKKRGNVILGVTISAFTLWVLQKRSYENALKRYRRVLPQDVKGGKWYANEDGSLYSEFEAQFRIVKSRARRTNQFLIAFGGFWLLGVTDAVLLQPNQITVQLMFD